ncbi:MAG: tetratricopeptide repeat protein [Acidobacteriota bacterium]
MPDPLSKAPPPPLTPRQRAHRRKQRNLVLGTVFGILFAVVGWQSFIYFTTAPERAEEKVQAGMQSLTPGKYEHAVELFTEALSIDPASWNAYYQRAGARVSLNAFQDALADFQTALQIKPDLLEARTGLAAVYSAKGDYRRAIDELTKTIDAKPSVDAYYHRGEAYARMGRHDDAIADFNWLIDKLRSAPYVYLARAKSRRALGDEAGALADESMADTFDFHHKLAPPAEPAVDPASASERQK